MRERLQGSAYIFSALCMCYCDTIVSMSAVFDWLVLVLYTCLIGYWCSICLIVTCCPFHSPQLWALYKRLHVNLTMITLHDLCCIIDF